MPVETHLFTPTIATLRQALPLPYALFRSIQPPLDSLGDRMSQLVVFGGP